MPTPDRHRVTLIPGDGVGPEITGPRPAIIEAAGVAIDWEVAEAGAEVFKRGDTSGVPRETARLDRADAGRAQGPARDAGRLRREERQRHAAQALRDVRQHPPGPRRCPGVPTRYAGEGVDFIVVRENIEDLYAGVEYEPTPDVAVRSRSSAGRARRRSSATPSSWRGARAARKVTCATKANILKLTEGMFKRIFEELRAGVPGDHGAST